MFEGEMTLTPNIHASLVTCAWALGASEQTLAEMKADQVVPIGVQRMIRWPGMRSAEQGALGRKRVAHMLRERKERRGHAAAPVTPILGSSWGWHPGVHDGVDLITENDDVLYAICDAEVIDVRPAGWWGNNPRPSQGHPVSDGDGIIQLRCLTDVGPFKKGMHFGYGHAEQATVQVGQHVKAGQKIGHAGFARAWHVHFMANGGGTSKGVGDRDPMPYVRYALGR
jgi:murein DD-endopeptidase MepM/ murein hydrolase activator NlpD